MAIVLLFWVKEVSGRSYFDFDFAFLNSQKFKKNHIALTENDHKIANLIEKRQLEDHSMLLDGNKHNKKIKKNQNFWKKNLTIFTFLKEVLAVIVLSLSLDNKPRLLLLLVLLILELSFVFFQFSNSKKNPKKSKFSFLIYTISYAPYTLLYLRTMFLESLDTNNYNEYSEKSFFYFFDTSIIFSFLLQIWLKIYNFIDMVLIEEKERRFKKRVSD